jgi:hypothetical protein
MTAPHLLAQSRRLLRSAWRSLSKARRALGLVAIVAVGGCDRYHEYQRAQCDRLAAAAELSAKYDRQLGCLIRCPSGLVTWHAFYDHGCPGRGDGGQ